MATTMKPQGLVFSVPGKAFLAGEYLALDGGLALLSMTEPRFELRVNEGRGETTGIPEGSPAWKFISRHPDFFSNLKLEFLDPHRGAGGWGASTAQYLSVFALHTWKQASNLEAEAELDTKVLLDEYRKDAWNGEGRAPSGADLIGQLKGGFTFFEKNAGMIAQKAWPFESYDGFLLKTGVKVATHEHLKKLSEADFSALSPLMEKIREAWTTSNADLFGESVTAYGKALAKQGKVAESTLDILHNLFWLNGIKGAKGCGAMGADVVFVMIEKNVRRFFEIWAQENEFEIVNVREASSRGLELKVESPVSFKGAEMPGAGL